MRGRQPYDTQQKILAIPHLFGKDETAFWKNFSWEKELEAGLLARGKEFSGEYDFVEKSYFWPITHMVAPKEEALGCSDCHSSGGRLANLSGFYMPGRDSFSWLDRIGWLLVLATLAGVLLHGLGRLFISRKRGQG